MSTLYNIGMIIARFSPREGGAETQCRHLSARLISQGHSVFVLTQRLPGTAAFEVIQGIPVYRVGLPLNGKVGSLSFLAACAVWLLLHRSRFDILHVHIASSPALLASIIGRLLSIPVLVKFAGSRATGDIALSLKTWYGRIKLRIISRFTLCIAPSREIGEELCAYGVPEQRVSVIPNGVDTSRFCPATPQSKRSVRFSLGIPDTAIVVAFAGRFEQGKGLELLLDTWKDTTDVMIRKDIFLLLIGNGRLEPFVKSASLNDPHIISTGWRNDPERYLSASDIYILPSSGEGMPNTLLEAMACGCACLATRIGGVTDIIEDGKNGILFSPKDGSGLSALFADLVGDAGTTVALGKEARQKVCTRFSLSATADRYLHLYADLISLKGGIH